MNRDLNEEKNNNAKQKQELNKQERICMELNAANIEKQKNLDLLNLKMNEYERQKRKLDRTAVQLENDKSRLQTEKLDAIQEKENAKSYMNNLFRDFNWLKKKTDEEQANIMKLERDRNMLKTALIKMEK